MEVGSGEGEGEEGESSRTITLTHSAPFTITSADAQHSTEPGERAKNWKMSGLWHRVWGRK